MNDPIPMVEIWRGDFLESIHMGHAVVCNSSGDIVQSWGNAEQVILPRSSAKMIQALPLIESAAANAADLSAEYLGLACASHNSATIHTDRVTAWLTSLGMSDNDLRCGAHDPKDIDAHHALIRSGNQPCQLHNNCSGKHTGFLTLSKHLNGSPEYNDLDHPVQLAVRGAFEDLTYETWPGFGIDGCSAPNFASTLHGFACAMAFFANAAIDGSSVRERAAASLVLVLSRLR
ncbi:MAG TPA: L-asparaginase, partial [Rhodobacteraceae bacterium]|nr:L-asparaginase [Paracoccaceae bacterium]